MEGFPSPGFLVERVREIRDEAGPDDQLFMFYGKRLHISKGDAPYLVMPGVSPIPLFDAVDVLEIAEDGSIGKAWPVVAGDGEAAVEEDEYEYVEYYEDELVNDPGQRTQVVDEEPED